MRHYLQVAVAESHSWHCNPLNRVGGREKGGEVQEGSYHTLGGELSTLMTLCMCTTFQGLCAIVPECRCHQTVRLPLLAAYPYRLVSSQGEIY